jgi:Spy/CpxP family protein refolding chaperone
MDRSTAFVLLLVALLTTAQAHANPPPDAPSPGAAACPALGPGGENPWLARIEELNLTPEQREAMKAIGERYRTQGHELSTRAGQIREQFRAVTPDAPGYAAATDAAAASTATLAADTVHLLAGLRAELYGLLTDEQRQRLAEKSRLERERWDDWRARHQPAQ